MKRKEEIEQAAKQSIKGDSFEDGCIGKGYFIIGAEWADNHPNLTWEDIRKICLIAKNVHKYYGFWHQTVYEEILDRFKKPEIWT